MPLIRLNILEQLWFVLPLIKVCPIVAGADFRIALPFEDPKAFDDTPLESEKYTERCRQIGREMLYVAESG